MPKRPHEHPPGPEGTASFRPRDFVTFRESHDSIRRDPAPRASAPGARRRCH